MSDDDGGNRFASVAETLAAADAEERDREDGDDPGTGGSDPAFPFGAVTMYPFYARKDAWDALTETAEREVEPALRERGTTGVRKRELHDAALRVAAANPAALVDAIAAARDED